jgi:predicted MFS family arabinose efflux permease
MPRNSTGGTRRGVSSARTGRGTTKSMSTAAPEFRKASPAAENAPPLLWPFLLGLSAVAGLAELAFIIVNVSALPVYLEFGLGLPHLVGYSLGAFYLAEALGNSPLGVLGDRLGRRRLMVMGALISVGTCLGTAFLRVPQGGGPLAWLAIGLLILLRVLDGVGAAALWPALFASVSDRIHPRRQAQAMSVLNITYFVGIALGPFVGRAGKRHMGERAGNPRPGPLRAVVFRRGRVFRGRRSGGLFCRAPPSRHAPAHRRRIFPNRRRHGPDRS